MITATWSKFLPRQTIRCNCGAWSFKRVSRKKVAWWRLLTDPKVTIDAIEGDLYQCRKCKAQYEEISHDVTAANQPPTCAA